MCLLALAALNRFRLTPALAQITGARDRAQAFDPARMRGRARHLRRRRRLALHAAAADASFPETPLAIHIHTDKAMFQVLVSPGKAGVDDFVLQLMTGEATPLKAKEATLTLSLPERGIEPMERDGRARARRLLARPQGRSCPSPAAGMCGSMRW